MPSTTIDLISENPTTGEFVLILVEDGPWPTEASEWKECLSRIQNRIYDALDVTIDGHLAGRYPDSKGKSVRIQIDSPDGAPEPLIRLVSSMRELLEQAENVYRKAIDQSEFVDQVRIVLGHELGV